MDKLEADDAAHYLLDSTAAERRQCADDAVHAARLAELLDGLPLALEQAAAFIAAHSSSFAAYLESWERERSSVLSWHDELEILLQNTNRLDEAEPLIRRALEIGEKSLGPEHPNVAIRLNNLATLLRATDRLDEAEPLMRRAVTISLQSYGPDHPQTQRAQVNLDRLLEAQCRLTDDAGDQGTPGGGTR